MSTRITVRARGPLVVEGPLELVDTNGHPLSVEGRSRVLLCRCGASRCRPFCDGAHNRTDFEKPEDQ